MIIVFNFLFSICLLMSSNNFVNPNYLIKINLFGTLKFGFTRYNCIEIMNKVKLFNFETSIILFQIIYSEPNEILIKYGYLLIVSTYIKYIYSIDHTMFRTKGI